MTRRELALAIGCHMMTVTKWEREGMPVAERGGRGRPSQYKEAEVRAWLQVREEAAKKTGVVDLVQDRARKERAQAALAEQAFQIRMRDLLPRSEIEQAWHSEAIAIRTKLLAWPTTISDKIFRAATDEGQPGVERVLSEAVRDALRELSDPSRPPGLAPSPGTAATAA
jgi:phage terminase Nu1 subunit (DNA packaging protein)